MAGVCEFSDCPIVDPDGFGRTMGIFAGIPY